MHTNASNEKVSLLWQTVQCCHEVHSAIDYRIDRHLYEHAVPGEPYVTPVIRWKTRSDECPLNTLHT